MDQQTWRRLPQVQVACYTGLHLPRVLDLDPHYVTPEQRKMIYAQWHWLFLSVFLETKEKRCPREITWRFEILFNAWLFAYIWPRPVWHKLPSILNGSQETLSFISTAMTFLYHFNCFNKMLHSEQSGTDKPVICQSGCQNQTRSIERFPFM